MERNEILACSLAIFLLLLMRIWLPVNKSKRNPKLFPLHPGPKPLPLLGNILDVPGEEYPWIRIAQWRKLYGDISRICVFGKDTLFVNSWTAANDLLEKRSAIYSDRLELVMLNEIVGWDWTVVSMPYNKEWRNLRRIFHQQFHGSNSAQYHPLQLLEVRLFLSRLLSFKSPESIMSLVSHTVVSSMMRVIYGIEVSQSDHVYDNLIEESGIAVSRTGVPGSFLVDLIPILKYIPSWVPGADFQKLGKAWHKTTTGLRTLPFNNAKKALAHGHDGQFAVAKMLKRVSNVGKSELTEDSVEKVAGIALAAGSDTTYSSIQAFFLAMILHPEIQAKAQAQIDSALESDRLPVFEDLALLPYVQAIMMEVLRYYPVTPLNLPHVSTEDDEYKRYFIPKGTAVIVNTWALSHDEDVYPEPFRFLPERFLDDSGNINPRIMHPDKIVFGYGRRICPGSDMGMNMIMITIASVLSVFNIGHATDEEGKPIPVKDEVTSGLLSHPVPFQCSITPRRSNASEIIQQGIDLVR